MRALDAELGAAGGMARLGNDDTYAVGPASVVFPALLKFADNVRARHALHFQPDKSEVFTWDGILPPEAPVGMRNAGVIVNDIFCPGLVVYGVPVGSVFYVKQVLDAKVDEIASEAY